MPKLLLTRWLKPWPAVFPSLHRIWLSTAKICGEAALYFPRFSPEALAELVIQSSQSAEHLATMRENGLLRSREFSWDKHVEQLLQLARRISEKKVSLERVKSSHK